MCDRRWSIHMALRHVDIFTKTLRNRTLQTEIQVGTTAVPRCAGYHSVLGFVFFLQYFFKQYFFSIMNKQNGEILNTVTKTMI